jgi:hypothetical protein
MPTPMWVFRMPVREDFFAMPPRPLAFRIPARPGAVSGMTVFKNPQEVVDVSFSMATNLPTGTALDSGEVYASRPATALMPDLSTALSSPAAAGDSSLQLPVDPLVGAFVWVNPGVATEERVLVTGVSGAGPFSVTVRPPLAHSHSLNEPVSYEPGVSAQVLHDTAAQVAGNVLQFRTKRGVSGRSYRLTIIGHVDSGEVRRGELTLSIVED